AFAKRATPSASVLAMVPPVTRTPLPPGIPSSSASQSQLLLHQRWRLIETSHVRIQSGGEHVCHHPQRRSVSLHPAEESRVQITVGIREHVPNEIAIRRFRT